MTLQLVYDGGCPFCRHFALRAELAGGLPQLQLCDGRSDHALRRQLSRRGLDLARGAVLIDGEQAWHGAAAIAELCRRMRPSDGLLVLLQGLFQAPGRAQLLYPLLLMARAWALRLQGLPQNPDALPGDLKPPATISPAPETAAPDARPAPRQPLHRRER